MAENGINDLLLDMRWPVCLGEVNKVRGKFRDRDVLAQVFNERDMFDQIHKIQKTVIDLSGIVPDIHGEDQSKLKDQEEKPFYDLHGIGNEKRGLHRGKNDQYPDHQDQRKMLDVAKEIIHQ